MPLTPFLRRLAMTLGSLRDRRPWSKIPQDEAKESPALATLANSLEPDAAAKARIWSRIRPELEPQRAAGVLHQLSELLEPESDLQQRLRSLVLGRLDPAPALSIQRWGVLKWSVAFLIGAIVLRSSPLLFLAPHTIAATSVMLSATRGTVSLGDEGLLQPITGNVTLEAPASLQTADGEATLALHSYGVVRLAPSSVFTLDDVSNHPTLPVTGSLTQGTAWVFGLVPSSLAGITIATPAGLVTVNEGSVSITVQDGRVSVDAWDRSVVVTTVDQQDILESNQRLVVGPHGEHYLSKLNPVAVTDWAQTNLTRDAAHRRELAQWQREVRAASAGILPTSPLYAVKRAAEAVDLMFTFGAESRAQKTLQIAETRLNEAAALLPENASDSVAATSQVLRLAASGASIVDAVTTGSVSSGTIVRSLLDEYQSTILALARASDAGTGSGTSAVADELAANSIQLAAALPSDGSYALKQAVLATTAALPDDGSGTLIVAQNRDAVLVDAIASLRTTLQDKPETDLSSLVALSPLLSELRSNVADNSPEVQREATSLERTIATLALQKRTEVALESASRRGPTSRVAPEHLSPAELDELTNAMLARISIYRLPVSRFNQLVAEMKSVEGSPSEGQILRRLDHALTDDPGLTARLHVRMRLLKEEHSDENTTSSGSQVDEI